MDIPSRTSKLPQIPPNFHLKVCLSIIRCIGGWPPQGTFRLFYFLYSLCIIAFSSIIFLFSGIGNLIVVWGDKEKMLTGASLLMTNLTCFCKTVIVFWRQNRIRALLDVTKSDAFAEDNDRYEFILRKYTWQGIFHHIAYQSSGATAVICWGLGPIADLIAGREKHLPLDGWYPFNTEESPAYEITLLHQVIGIVFASIHNVAMDTFVTGLITVGCCQLALLQLKLTTITDQAGTQLGVQEKLIEDNVEAKLTKDHQDEMYERLKGCVRHTNEIYRFAKEIQDIFGTVIFLQLFVNCFIVCLTAFQISQMEVYTPDLIIGMSMYLMCMIYQIFLYCWHGNELFLHGANVALAAYFSNWWQCSHKFRRAIPVIIVRARKPLILYAGNIMSLSLETFVNILRMSYSILTVLQSSTNN